MAQVRPLIVVFFALLGMSSGSEPQVQAPELVDQGVITASPKDIFLGAEKSTARQDAIESDEAKPTELYGAHGMRGQTVTHQSAGNIMKDKMNSAMFGFVLFVLGFPVLWFNEQRQAKMEVLFGRAARIARTDVNSEKVDPQYERCLVHMQGTTSTTEQLEDQAMGASIKVTNCAHLRRSTEMLQWVESSTKEEKDDNWGGKTTTTTYSYAKKWTSEAVDSSSFNDPSYQNPTPPCELGSKKQTVDKLTFGAFTLPSGLVSGLCSWTNCTAESTLSEGRMSSGELRHMGDHLGTGSGDNVGDLRITFEKVPCGPATILAVQSGDSFEPMDQAAQISSDGKVIKASGLKEPLNPGAQNIGIDFDGSSASFSGGCCSCCQACGAVGTLIEAGESIFQIQEAHLSAKEILEQAASAQNCCHQVGKYGGWLMLVIGLNMIFDPFPALFRFIPFVGTYMQHFVGWLTGAVAFLLGSALATFTVALAWLYARPAKAVQYFLITFALIGGIYALAGMYGGKTPDGPKFE